MSKPHIRKKYLINPGFQFRFLAFVAIALLISLTALYLSNSIYFNSLVTQGQEIGLDPSHPYYVFIEEQRTLLNQTYLLVAGTMSLLLISAGLIMSAHIAGPLYHVHRVLNQLIADPRNSARIRLRKWDFFKELEPAVNRMIDSYQELVEYQSRKSLAYIKDVSAVKAVAGARLLLVEDNEINRVMATELLSSNGVEVETATNGQEALDILKNDDQFDGILMDGQMPVMDGYEAIRRIRMDERFTGLPIIAMSASLINTEQDQLEDLGITDHVSKPIDVSQLFSTLAKQINPRNAIYDRNTGLEREDQSHRLPEVYGLNLKEGLKRTQQDLHLYKRLLRRFLDTQSNFENQFTDTLESGGVREAERLAHNLTGVAGNIGATNVQSLAASLEEACRNNSDREEVLDRFRPLANELNKLLAELPRALTENEAPPQNRASSDDGHIDQLRDLVKQNDTSALILAEKIEAEGRNPETDTWTALIVALRAYDFDEAGKILERMSR